MKLHLPKRLVLFQLFVKLTLTQYKFRELIGISRFQVHLYTRGLALVTKIHDVNP